MKKLICILLILSLTLGLSACASEPQSENLMESITPNPDMMLTSGEEEPLIMDFYVRLFRETYKQDQNTLISPLSILQALAMTANGAEGETLRQMEAVFGLNLEMLNYSVLDHDDGTGKFKMANSIWFRDAEYFTVKEDFLQTNADHYGAGIFKAPFDKGTCREINAWVEENTDGMIRDILNEIPDEAVMYLVNALAFDAQWQDIYTESAVREGEFTTQRGFLRTVEMMHSEESLYLDDGFATGFIKYYEGGRYAFAALMPNVGITVEEYLGTLTGEHLDELLSNPYVAQVWAAMPKFQVEYDVEMSEILKAMGMNDAFDGGKADFSGIGQSERGNLYISQVLHKTFICVDERGTKAGAATAVEVSDECAAVEPDFYAVTLDRPFVYMLIDTRYNRPLFMGAMMDPTGEPVMPIEEEEALSEPPELNVLWDDGAMVTKTGNYSWEGPAVNGQNVAVIACGAHPLDNVENREFTTVSGQWLTLSFPVWPDEVSITRWPAEEIGNTDAWGQAVELNEIYLPLEEGNWVYQIIAKWSGDGWGGNAEYHLYISR